MKKIAVILSGCGHMDGAEIQESVITLLAIDRAGAEAIVFAPDINKKYVVNHLTGKPTGETRNVLLESARIARGDISPLSDLNADNYDALIITGGYGVANNLSNLAEKGADADILPDFKRALLEFVAQKKPIGAICIAPAVVAVAIGEEINPTLTIGDDKGTADLIEACGGTHINCPTDDIVVDEKNKIVSCSAYMRNDTISNVATGIEKLVNKVVELG